MALFAQIMSGIVLLIHMYIFALETFLFRQRGWKVFGFARENIELLRPIVSNQGCYNGFLVLALVVGFVHPEAGVARAFHYFGLLCVAIAGVWGAATIMPRILLIQTLPAVLGLLALAFS